ncbi:MAG: phage tail protein [Gammaproteobacteria bacterium]|jgi:hypothetical protein|nr:phage tail protein [Gammaproteobacteria bacterium]
MKFIHKRHFAFLLRTGIFSRYRKKGNYTSPPKSGLAARKLCRRSIRAANPFTLSVVVFAQMAGMSQLNALRRISFQMKPVELIAKHRNAGVSFALNLGAGPLQRSTLRWKVNRVEHEAVPAELMKRVGRWEKVAWVYSPQTS